MEGKECVKDETNVYAQLHFSHLPTIPLTALDLDIGDLVAMGVGIGKHSRSN
jgi:hypothetical protein